MSKQKLKTNHVNRSLAGFCSWEDDVLVLNVLGTPSAKQDVIGKVKGQQLKISVTASPEEGKATDHMLRFLAKQFGVKIKDIEVVYGRFDVNKQLRIRAPKQLPTVIQDYLASKTDIPS